jgi:hypothetical protein
MSTIEQVVATESGRARPMRADARRNYEKVLAAARDAFAAGGSATSLEEIARQASVGIGTLYRHFPNRQALLEAVTPKRSSLCAGRRETSPTSSRGTRWSPGCEGSSAT